MNDQEQIIADTKDLLHSLRQALPWQDVVKLFGQTVELMDIHPEGAANPVPVILVPGFTGTAEAVRVHARELASKGRRVLCVNTHHGLRIKGMSTTLPQTRKAIALVGTLERKGLTKVDAVGYSEAALTIVAAANLRPGLFRNLVLVNPSGLIANDTILRLILRFVWDKFLEGVGEFFRTLRKPWEAHARMHRLWKTRREKMKSVFSDPIQTAREIRAICNVMIHQWLYSLQSRYDINVALVQSPGDRVFPPAQTAEFIKKAGIPQDHVFSQLRGMHDTMLSNPEHAMDIVERVLRTLETKHEHR